MSTPILSIVIPTKDRYETLLILIDYILGWGREDVSVIVHDNSTDNSLMQNYLVQRGPDAKLIYTHNPSQMSMVENFCGAMGAANGKYVCLLGDDDGLVESTIDLCYWMAKQGIDSATFDRPRYDWPNLLRESSCETKDTQGTLVIPQCDGHIQSIDIDEELTRYLQAAVTNYKNYGPAPYNGLVARKVFELTLETTGSYFPGTTPGMAASISAFLAAKKHVHIGIPFICGGHSFKSAAGLGRRGQHVGEIRDIKSLASDTADLWSPELPLFWSGFTINAESAIQTINSWNRADLRKRFNFDRVIAACMIYLSNEYRLRCLTHIKATHGTISYTRTTKEYLQIQMARAANLLRRRSAPSVFSYHKTIAGALDHLQSSISHQFDGVAPNKNFDKALSLHTWYKNKTTHENAAQPTDIVVKK